MGEHGKHRALVNPRTLLAILLGLSPVAAAADCRLALAVAIDVSSSVDAAEDVLQRSGLSAALITPRVEAAVFASPLPIAIAVYEWSGRYNQEILVDWTLIENRGDLLGVAELVARSKRSHNEFPTAMGYALGFGAGLLQRAPRCDRKVLDMAGDGENNEGFTPPSAYAEFPFAGVTVNGLVVDVGKPDDQISLTEYYEKVVLFGPGAFLEVADGFDDYEHAMARKLEREIMPRAVGSLARHRPGPG